MSSIPQETLKAAALKCLTDDIGDTLTQDKAGLVATMSELGITGLVAKLPDGTKVATLPNCGGEDRAYVADEAKLVAWVERNRPDEIVKSIRPQTLKAILAAATEAAVAVDPATGDVIPGIEFGPSTPYTQVNFVKGKQPGEDGRSLIREACRSGALDLHGLLALPEGGAS